MAGPGEDGDPEALHALLADALRRAETAFGQLLEWDDDQLVIVQTTGGEPAGKALDESWVSYGYSYDQGGGGVAVCGGVYGLACVPLAVSTMEAGRLLVFFDDADVVENTRFERKTCSRLTEGKSAGLPCLDITGMDLPIVRRPRQ